MTFVRIFLVVVGIVGCAIAGKMKETHMAGADDRPRESAAVKMSPRRVVIVILAGIGSPLIKFGLAFGDTLKKRRRGRRDVSPGMQANVIWAP